MCIRDSRENYAKATVVGPYIPPEQLAWLEREITDDRYFYVICTLSLIHIF